MWGFFFLNLSFQSLSLPSLGQSLACLLTAVSRKVFEKESVKAHATTSKGIVGSFWVTVSGKFKNITLGGANMAGLNIIFLNFSN